MVRRFVLSLALLLAYVSAFAQTDGPTYEKRQVVMPTEQDQGTIKAEHREYSKLSQGFWFSVEGAGGYSLNLSDNVDNAAMAEVALYGGYRFNEYVRVGIGLGARYYFSSGNLRNRSHNWGIPVMFNVRGNFIPQDYRTVIPYYSLDLGCSVTDGFMFRPTIGVRFGERRSAFLLGLSYMMQNMQGWEMGMDEKKMDKTRSVSFLLLKLGYEF